MSKRLRSAVLFYVLLILFSGCSKTQPTDQTVEHIRISNLKTSSSALTQEEQAYMNEICDILETAEYVRNEGYFGSIHAQNSSQYDLDLIIKICGFNEDGQLRYNRSMTLKGWKKGQKLSWGLSSNYPSDVETFTLIGEYVHNGITYMTDPISLPIGSDQENSTITINHAGYLPTVVSLDQDWTDSVSYSLLDFSAKNDNGSVYHSLSLLIRKESGEDNQGDSIAIRILDEDGHVHYSGSNTVYLSCGETARVVFSIPIYEPGEYYLELK